MTHRFDLSILLSCLLWSSLPAQETKFELPRVVPDSNAQRADIPKEYLWNLTHLCPSDDIWKHEMAQAEQALEELSILLKDLSSEERLAEGLAAFFALDEKINRLTLYANLQREVQSSDQMRIAQHQRALQLTNGIMASGPALRSAILNTPPETMAQAMQRLPQMKQFAFTIKNFLRRQHCMRSPETEKVLALAGDNLWAQIDLNELPSALETTFRALISDLELPTIKTEDGREVALQFSNYGRYRASDQRRVRHDAVAALMDTLKTFENTFAATLSGQAQFSFFLARARGYDTVLEAYLDKDQLDPSVYHTLIQTVRRHLDLLHRYVDLRQRVMNIDAVHLYDLYVPLAPSVGLTMDYPHAVALIGDALKPLGPAYQEPLMRALDPTNGWLDLYPYRDKESGAFSTAAYGVHPYIKMNFQNAFDDVSTLAHELGHAMHSYWAMKAQPYQSWRYPPFLAEIASTCNEVLLIRHMIRQATSDREKAWLLSEHLESIRTTIFRQTLFAEFELKLHELVESGKPITAQVLNDTYAGLIRDYYGPHYTMDDNDHMEWAYIPHFYYKYYVFTYATGLSCGIYFADRLFDGEAGARVAYLGLLKGGCSDAPLTLLKTAGLDLARPDAIEAAMAEFDATLTQLEKIL